jgi:hypothetical protein
VFEKPGATHEKAAPETRMKNGHKKAPTEAARPQNYDTQMPGKFSAILITVHPAITGQLLGNYFPLGHCLLATATTTQVNAKPIAVDNRKLVNPRSYRNSITPLKSSVIR